jgi:phosphoribosylaminoimidazolecarboxamide formyltransferase/IMP cyclohydrolase
MSEPLKIRRALISVYDKTGVVEFARTLHDEFAIEIISTGGTAEVLTKAGIPVTLVEDITGCSEMLDGRVKTLHPKIHAAILADRDNPAHMRQLAEQGIEPIDMVVVNLYPFEQTIAKPGCTFDEAIEMIDIGGPCLLRAAAKNSRHVLVLVPSGGPWSSKMDYRWCLDAIRKADARPDARTRAAVDRAHTAFWTTEYYDGQIAKWLLAQRGTGESVEVLHLLRAVGVDLVYGENPHQQAELRFSWETASRQIYPPHEVCRAIRDDNPPLSFNNLADASAALELCAELTRARTDLKTCCFIKHANACGAAVEAEPLEAYRKAYLGDPNAALGGILTANFNVDVAFAGSVMETYARWGKVAGAGGFFVEVWLAPSFDKDAVEVIRTKKDWGRRVRLLDVGDMSIPPDPNEMDFKRIADGVLMQTRDLVGLNEEQWKVVTQRAPTAAELDDLRLAWLICKHTKSNAITICKDGMLLGNGAGQMSRVMSCRIATWLAQENGHADQLKGAAAASDAFFPFRDGPDILLDAGVTALIQPGGSKRDADTIAACDERGVAMIFTGTRHFKH